MRGKDQHPATNLSPEMYYYVTFVQVIIIYPGEIIADNICIDDSYLNSLPLYVYPRRNQIMLILPLFMEDPISTHSYLFIHWSTLLITSLLPACAFSSTSLPLQISPKLFRGQESYGCLFTIEEFSRCGGFFNILLENLLSLYFFLH